MMPQASLRQKPDTTSRALHAGADVRPSEPGSVVVPQVGKPPLRFKGRRLTQHWTRMHPGPHIVIELWERKTGGFVVSHSHYSKGTLQPIGMKCATIAEAMDYLEQQCGPPRSTFETDTDLCSVLLDLQQRLGFSQQFERLAGEVLADWSDRVADRREKT